MQRLVPAAACLVLAACGGTAASDAPSAPPSVAGTAMDAAVPRAVLDVPLVDHRGRALTLGSLKGRIVVLSDMMTLCQEACPIGTAAMLQAARAVDRAGLGGKVEFVSLTIDPTRDDRRHVAAYRRAFGATPGWETATGDPRAVNRLWDRLGVWRRRVHVSAPYPRDWLTGEPLTADVQHTDDLIFIDADQRFRFELDGAAAVSPAAMPARIAGFMDELGHRNLERPSPHSWSGRDVERVLHWLLKEQGAA